jgi:hypothetical protein
VKADGIDMARFLLHEEIAQLKELNNAEKQMVE